MTLLTAGDSGDELWGKNEREIGQGISDECGSGEHMPKSTQR